MGLILPIENDICYYMMSFDNEQCPLNNKCLIYVEQTNGYITYQSHTTEIVDKKFGVNVNRLSLLRQSILGNKRKNYYIYLPNHEN